VVRYSKSDQTVKANFKELDAMKMTPDKRALDKIYRRRNRYEIPDWQRDKGLWERSKKQELIDSILRGWKLPKLYFLKTSEDPDEFEVVDGQQRLTTIFQFFDDELPLSEKSAKEFGGKYYKDLPQIYVDRFDDFEIQYDVIEDADESDLKLFFQRLQQGLPLTSSEKLNSVHSKLRDYTKSLSKHAFLKSKVAVNDKRYAHFDIVAKVATIELEGIKTGLRYDDLKDVFESQANFSAKSAVAKRLQAIFDYLDGTFTEKSSLLRNRTVVQSFATFVSRLIQTEKSKGHEDKVLRFFTRFMKELATQVELGPNATDSDLTRFQKSINANVKSAAQTRQEILLRKMLMLEPALVDLFDPTIVAESGLNGRNKELGDSITTLIHAINTAYAAENGEDLFKATNKTSYALTTLGKSLADYTEYQGFIDKLYFVFHEGVGRRLDGKKPGSFADVNTLRTELQHDVDHGDRSKIKAARTKAGLTFEKYSGIASPLTLAPERFAIVQATILSALEADLKSLPAVVLKKVV
jgi:hypothetical protein